MGLIKAAAEVIGAISGGLNTTANAIWVDYYESGNMSGGIIMKRGEKIVGPKSKNKSGDDNMITSGSGIDVQANQCMILVENGQIVEFCAEPGRYTYDNSKAPSFITGENKGLKALAQTLGQQVLAGGQRTNTERVYYINMGEIQGFKWGSGNISFQHVEHDLASGKPVWQVSTTLQGNGVYSIHVTDPAKFFQVLGATVAGTDGNGVVKGSDIDGQIKTEVIAAIRQGIGGMSKLQIPYTDIASHEAELSEDVNNLLSESWGAARGIEIFKIAIGMMDADEESKDKISKYQETKGYTDPSMLASYMGVGQTEAMKSAGANANGAMQGFAGVGMLGGMTGAFGTGGGNVAQMMQMGQNQEAASQQNATPQQGTAPQAETTQAAAPAVGWTCTKCGAVNKGKFCTECGTSKPADAPLYKCDKCGWEPADPKNPPKFCPNCGDIFDEKDQQ